MYGTMNIKFSYCNATTSFLWIKFTPQLSDTYKELCINVLFVHKYVAYNSRL
jgi:hypothetical protein